MRFLFFLLLLISFTKASESSYELGKNVYIKNGCYSCHGRDLEGLHNYPYLANRAKGYMSYKLTRFRSKISENQQQDMMIPFALNLSDADIDNLTTFMYEFVKVVNKKKYDDRFYREGDGGS